MRAAAAGKAIFCEKPVDLAVERARDLRARPCKRAGVTCLIGFQRRYDPTFAALKARLVAGEIGEPEMLVVTSRDPGAPPVDYIEALGRHLQGHADPRLRHLPLDPRRRSGDASTRPAAASPIRRSATVGDIDSTAVTIRTKQRPARADQHQPPRGLRLRPALRGARQQGHAAGGQSPADRGRRVDRGERQRRTSPSISSSSAIAPRTRARWRISSTRSRSGKPVRTTIEDGVKALELAEAATTSWREKRIVEL